MTNDLFEKRPHLMPSLVVALMLFGALLRWPYGYYQLLRLVVCGVGVYVAVKSYGWGKVWATWLFGFIAVLFNPLIPVHLTREIWQAIDVTCAVLFLLAILVLPQSLKISKKKSTYAMSPPTAGQRTAVFVLCILLGAVFIWLDHSPVRRKRQPGPKSDQQAEAYDFEKYHAKTFTAADVVDGDTIDIDIPDGKYEHTRIRLWGIDTPETKNPKLGVMYFGPQAADFTRKLTLGKPVQVYLEEHRTRGKYDRLLAYVKLPDGRFLNEVLLTEGFAYADLRFRHSFYNKYRQLEASARSQKKGLWEEVTRPQLPEWLQRKRAHLLLNK